MEPNFWHQKWTKNEIAFHEPDVNPSLVKHLHHLNLPAGARIFLPLCGKTLDMAWLLANGYRVAGAELSKIAITQLFKELKLTPHITANGRMEHYQAKNIDIYVGDIFDLNGQQLGPVEAIYDRAALVALPGHMRERYALHLMTITHKAPQLLICYEYDQNVMAGPPFAIVSEDVKRYYDKSYDVNCVEHLDVMGGLKGKCPAQERVWVLKKHEK